MELLRYSGGRTPGRQNNDVVHPAAGHFGCLLPRRAQCWKRCSIAERAEPPQNASQIPSATTSRTTSSRTSRARRAIRQLRPSLRRSAATRARSPSPTRRTMHAVSATAAITSIARRSTTSRAVGGSVQPSAWRSCRPHSTDPQSPRLTSHPSPLIASSQCARVSKSFSTLSTECRSGACVVAPEATPPQGARIGWRFGVAVTLTSLAHTSPNRNPNPAAAGPAILQAVGTQPKNQRIQCLVSFLTGDSTVSCGGVRAHRLATVPAAVAKLAARSAHNTQRLMLLVATYVDHT